MFRSDAKANPAHPGHRVVDLIMSRYSFDVSTALGIGTPDASPLPEDAEGEIVLRVPEGICPRSLRKSPVGKALLWQGNTWYDKYAWSSQSLPPGIYRLRLPIPDSNRKTFKEQKALLLEGQEVAPLVLAELALLCMQKAGHPDPLKNGFVRCRETADGYRVVLYWSGGRLYVYSSYVVDCRRDSVWLASARTS